MNVFLRNSALFAFLALISTHALSLQVTGLAVSFECDRFETNSFNFILDRDNTGFGAEGYIIRVFDGADVTLYELDLSAGVPLGPRSGAAGANSFTGAPTANPLTFQWTSIAGNGFPEQIAFSSTGSCSTITTAPQSVPALPVGGLLLLGLGLTWLARRRMNLLG